MSVYFVSPETEVEQKPETNVNEEQCQTQSEAQAALTHFWPKVMDEIKSIGNMDLKQQVLPLARIKKIMKLDEDVKMISAEAPLLFAKAAEIFIHELTLRSWIHTEDNKRRTLQRNDIAMAITKFDQFDFLIDIVPRDDIKPSKPREETTRAVNSDQVHYYFQLAQQHHASLQNSPSQTTAPPATTAPTQGTIQIVQPQQVQTVQVNAIEQNATTATNTSTTQTPVMIQQTAVQPASPTSSTNGGIQILQQIISPSGEIQQIPIQLSPQQLQMIRMQLQNNSTQPLIIQTTPIQTAPQPQLVQIAQQGTTGQPVFITQANGTTETE
ncbi:nuclear transcription factor Y subunit gamma isoform X2 [Onthophagus taurus]|uniref:nuclear transcription factor Y subunit gamma isoform X2 n=1 Tax=Onthophagus taurus TaxID=166361 RepID=UPI000C1FFB47|nr:nuclear transcription factor Y subunit gamma-like isoform X2 [Onthophagus taurus]